jgi:hypothetical protein
MMKRTLPLFLSAAMCLMRPPVRAEESAISESVALKYALVGTAFPIGTATASLFLGDPKAIVFGLLASTAGLAISPSAGQFYAHDAKAAWIGTGIRAAGGGLLVFGLADALDKSDCKVEDDGIEIHHRCSDAAPSIEIILGTATLLGGVIYGIADAAPAARRFNAAHAQRVGFTPLLGPTPEGSWTAGGQAWMRF